MSKYVLYSNAIAKVPFQAQRLDSGNACAIDQEWRQPIRLTVILSTAPTTTVRS